MTIAKFEIFLYFAQIISILCCFPKYGSKILQGFSFLEMENHHFSCQPPPKMGENCAFLFSLAQINEMISINVLWVAPSACLAVSKALI